MPSLFMPEESLYDRYAACLAATEGLRRIRDRDLAEEVTLRAGFGTAADSSSSVPGASATRDTERQINLRYLQNSERVLKALGMSINQFNDLGRQVTQDEKLREKVCPSFAVAAVFVFVFVLPRRRLCVGTPVSLFACMYV
jgi:hypothetical protein